MGGGLRIRVVVAMVFAAAAAGAVLAGLVDVALGRVGVAERSVRCRGGGVDPVIAGYGLSRDPHTCVRFDRHALYLGRRAATSIVPPTRSVVPRRIDRAAGGQGRSAKRDRAGPAP